MRNARFLVTLPGVPRRWISRIAGAAARLRVPRRWRGRVWPFVARRLHIERSEVPGDWTDYPRFLDLFARPLPEGARPLPLSDAWLSPADGTVLDHSVVSSEGSWLIKGTPYSSEELLPGSDARALQGFQSVQIYLAPHNYHRFHAPCDLAVLEAVTAPGDLLPVDPRVVGRSHRVLARNRRVLLRCRSGDGAPLWLLFVGALNVGRMRFTFDATLGQEPIIAGRRRYDPPPWRQAGAEMGRFELGSTIVLFVPPGRRLLVGVGSPCRVREPLLGAPRNSEA
ncbi:MAG: phosphatidylserine decarboxylase [Planctomycetota bacterium]|nr:MAG: phosphatidylserine decarboxylase [Planctomycetota bacterium]